jgi:pyruvate/2-oxoglutarate dehydrogenase complex dihydrolipoamide dehydrogenase (E3) component
MKRFDAIVIGAGQAGPSLATRLAAAGQNVAIVERKLFGGTCVNTGCIPTKALVASAKVAHQVRRAADFGVTIDGRIGFDVAAANARAHGIAMKSRTNIESWLRGTKGLTVLQGHARFVGDHTISVNGEELSAERIFINTGGRARIPTLAGLGDVPYLTNSSLLELEVLPRHLVIIGGGPIGLEFGQMYRRFGSEVTIIEMGARLLPREDDDVASALKEILESEGVKFRLGATCISLQRKNEEVRVGLDCESGAKGLTGSHVLLAVGRQPNTDDLGLDRAGVEVDARGFIRVDDHLRTNVPGIWAVGEVNGHGAFTHTAYNDYEIVAANVLDGDNRKLSDRIDTYAIYTDPPLARLGLSEAAARADTSRKYLVANRPMKRVMRSVEKGESQGFMRAIVDAETNRIVGATILGVDGDEAIHGVLFATYAGGTAKTVTRSMAIHPTVSELLPTLLGDLKPLA